jgi:hypothetical protein
MIALAAESGRLGTHVQQLILHVATAFVVVWRYRCDAEWLAAAENEVDKEERGRDTF